MEFKHLALKLLQICRWSRSLPPNAKNDQLPTFAITGFLPVYQPNQHWLSLLLLWYGWEFTLLYLQSLREDPIDLLLICSSDVSTVCWHLPASSLLGNTNPLTAHTSCRQDHYLYSLARALEPALTQGLWCTRRAAPDGARNCARWCITSTAEHTPHPQQSFWLPSASTAVQSAVPAGCLEEQCSRPYTYMCFSPEPAEGVLDPL